MNPLIKFPFKVQSFLDTLLLRYFTGHLDHNLVLIQVSSNLTRSSKFDKTANRHSRMGRNRPRIKYLRYLNPFQMRLRVMGADSQFFGTDSEFLGTHAEFLGGCVVVQCCTDQSPADHADLRFRNSLELVPIPARSASKCSLACISPRNHEPVKSHADE